jgi:hypothetical protein
MTRLAIIAALVLTGPMLASAPASAKGARAVKSKNLTNSIEFEGKLQNARRRPVSGVYPLKFALYKGPKGGKAVWSESHFVAVDSGRYVITLGEKKALKKRFNLSKLYLGVSYAGGGEIQRELIEAQKTDESPAGTAPVATSRTGSASRTAAAATTVRTTNGRTTVDYAEEAGIATYAHSAESAKRIGDLDEKDLLKRLDSRSGGKVSIGTKTRFSASAGGEGGSGYDVRCPKGTVVTGVRGTAGIYLDSIQLICSPVE